MIDANQRWSLERPSAPLDALAVFDLAWIEEPPRADDLAAHVARSRPHRRPDRRSARTCTPPYRFPECIDAGAVDACSRTSCGSVASRPSLAIAGARRRARGRGRTAPAARALGAARPGPARAHLVEAVEDAVVRALGVLASPSPVAIDGTRVRTSRVRLDSGIRFDTIAERMPRHPQLARELDDDHRSLTSLRRLTSHPPLPGLPATAALALRRPPAASIAAERAAWLARDRRRPRRRPRRARRARGRRVPSRRGPPHAASSPAPPPSSASSRRPSSRAPTSRRPSTTPSPGPPRPDRPPPDAATARSRGGVQGIELPVRVLGRGRRHRRGPRGRLPRHRQGALGHPGSPRRTAEIVADALAAAGAPAGTFGTSRAASRAGAHEHPVIQRRRLHRVRAGGRLSSTSRWRPEPIPFYGELGR